MCTLLLPKWELQKVKGIIVDFLNSIPNSYFIQVRPKKKEWKKELLLRPFISKWKAGSFCMTSSQSERKSTKKGSGWKCLFRYASYYWELMDRYGKCPPNVAKCFLLAFAKWMAIQEKGVMCPDSRLISPYWPHWYWGESYLRRMLCTQECDRLSTKWLFIAECRRSREHRKLCKKVTNWLGGKQ